MKKLLLLSLIPLGLISCDMKDKEGNASLVEDDKGYLVDNPEYKTDAKYKYDENMAAARSAYKESMKDGSDVLNQDAENPTISTREVFANTFKPKTGSNKITLSGKDKTTITFSAAFNNDYTPEQFDNLDYFSKLKELGFKKVIISDGEETIAVREL